MFTGIIEETGTVKAITRAKESAVLVIGAKDILCGTRAGDSIAVNGVCLTATAVSGTEFTADVMHETLNRSSLGQLGVNDHVNLERAMAADGRFGGHIVSGHIDGTGTVERLQKDGSAVWFTIKAPPGIMRYIIEKGSVAIDGISLTVARAGSGSFEVSVIPHTAGHTALLEKKPGDIVNLENDCIGKYVERLLLFQEAERKKESAITADFLGTYGFL